MTTKKDPDVGTCKLCRQKARLHESHVVPRFFLRAIGEVASDGKRKGQRMVSLVRFGDDPSNKDVQAGDYERRYGLQQKLFCGGCELKLSRWEKYAREVLYGNVPGPDIKKRDLGRIVSAELGVEPSTVKAFRDLREVAVDYKLFKLFELSLIWRAGLENMRWGKKVNLGHYQEDLRLHLLNEDAVSEDFVPALLIDPRHEIFDFEKMGTSVSLLDNRPCHIYEMALGGYAWRFFVGKNLPAIYSEFFLKETGHLRIIVFDGTPVLLKLKAFFRTLPPTPT
jgi:hypothetical protein